MQGKSASKLWTPASRSAWGLIYGYCVYTHQDFIWKAAELRSAAGGP